MATPPTPPSPPGGQSPADLSAQIEATKQLAAAMAALSQQISKTNQGIRDQSDVSNDLAGALDDIAAQREKDEKEARERQEQLEKEIKSIKSLGDLTSLLSKELTKAAEGSKKMAVGMAAVSGAAKGFKAGISMMNSVLGAMGGILSTVIGTVFDLGIAILTGPIKMFNALFAKAKAGMTGASELAQALEKVRENFGDVGSGLGGTVASMGSQLTHGLIAPGLSAVKVFGSIAEATNYANEMASQAPATFQKLSAQFQDSALEALAMAKGLGISKEEFAGLMSLAVSSGRDIVDIETEMTKFAKGMAAEFRLNSKMISRDMGRAMKDVKHFANLTVKELAKAATYAQGLGLELKDITGILDAFNTFESAAENVSKLSQAFGVNLDTMKLLEAESPDEQIAHVKQAFEAAGKSADQMNRRELQLLAQTLNMDEAMVRQALSTKNVGISMDAVKASSAGLEGQTMSTGEAMKALSKDIERVIKTGEPPKGDNFIEVFLEGVMEGMERTSAFRQLLLNMMRSIHAVRMAGRDLGAQLMEVIPGLKEMIKGLADLVSPDKLGGMFRAFSKSFVDFFQTLKSGGVASVKDLVENLKKNFLDYLTKAGAGGQSFLNGLSDMWEAAKKIIVSAIDYLGEILESGINLLTDIITGNFNEQASSIAGGVLGQLAPILEAFGNLFARLKEPATKLLEAAFDFIVDKIGGFLLENWTKILGGYLSLAFTGAFIRAFAAATSTVIMQTVITPFLRMLATQVLMAAASNSTIGGGITVITTTATTAAGAAAAPFQIGAATFGMMAAFMVAALVAMGVTIAAMRYYDVTQEEAINAGIVIAAAGVLVVAAGMAATSMAAIGAKAPLLFSAIAGAVMLVPVVYGMMHIAEEIIDLAVSARRKRVGLSEVMAILPVLGVTALLIIEAAAITAALMAVGSIVTGSGGTFAVALLIGLATLAVVVGAMIITAGEIINNLASQNFDPSKVNSVVSVIEAVGDLYIKTFPIMGSIAAAIALLPLALFAGLAFKKVQQIVDKVIETSIGVIEKIEELKISDASVLKSKIEPFISIMNSVVELIESIGNILGSAAGSAIAGIISSFTGHSPFDGAAEMVQNLIGRSSEDKNSGIVGLLRVIQESLTSLKIIPTETISAFVSTLAAVSGTIANLATVISSLKSKYKTTAFGGAFTEERERSPEVDSIRAMSRFVSVLMPAVGELVSSIKNSLTGVSVEEAKSIGAMAQGIGSVLSATGTLFGSLTESIGQFRQRKTARTGQVERLDIEVTALTEEFDKFDTEAFSSFVGVFKDNIGPILDEIKFFMENVLSSITQSISKISPSQIEAIKPVFDLLVAVFSMISTMYSSLGNVELGSVGGAMSFASNQIVVNIPSATSIISQLAVTLPLLFAVLGPAINAFSLAPGYQDKISSMKDAMSAVSTVLKTITEVFPDIQDASGAKVPDSATSSSLQKKIQEMSTFITSISSKRGEGNELSDLEKLTKALDSIPTGPKAESVTKLKAYAESLTNLSDVAKALENVEKQMPVMTTPESNETKGPSPIAAQIENIKKVIEALGDKESGIPSLESSITTASANIASGGGKKLSQLMEQLQSFTSVNELPEVVSAIATALPAEAATSSFGALDKALTEFESQINKVVGSRPIDIQAKLKNNLGKIGIQGAQYKIDAKPIALNLNLNVTMNAGDVASGIASASTIIRSRIEQLAARAGVQGYDISQTIPTATQ